jgi:hypothetical protein
LSTQKLQKKKKRKRKFQFRKTKKKTTDKTKNTKLFFRKGKGHELCRSRLRRADCFGARSDRGHDYADGDSDARAGEPVRRG